MASEEMERKRRRAPWGAAAGERRSWLTMAWASPGGEAGRLLLRLLQSHAGRAVHVVALLVDPDADGDDTLGGMRSTPPSGRANSRKAPVSCRCWSVMLAGGSFGMRLQR
jgi:hypothetical protein